MSWPLPSIALVLSIVLLSGCVSHRPPSAAAQEFERLYSAWHYDFETEGDGSSNVHWEVGRPSYRNIVGMGKPALPFLKQKLEENKGPDCLLAFAVVEIYGWDAHEFWGAGYPKVQEFRTNVLRKMKANK